MDKSRNVIEDDVEIPFKITANNFQKRCADLFLWKKRVFKVYHTAYPLRIISKGKDLEKMSYGKILHVFCMISVLTCSLS